MKKLIVTALCCLMMAVSSDIFACTSAIISGRVTPDGRPLLWKHRDTGAAQNLVRYFHGDKYAFSAIAQTDNPNQNRYGWESTGGICHNEYDVIQHRTYRERGECRQ